jgi:integrase
MWVESYKGNTGIKKRYWVPIYDRAMAVLKRRPHLSEFVFCNEKGDLIPENGVIHNFERIISRLQIPNFTFHDIRHTFATNRYRETADLLAVMMMLGHSSLKMTQRYLNLTDLDLHVARERKFSTLDIRQNEKTAKEIEAEL